MKNAKRNVIVSAILTIALCFSLMIGGTYAWFTDSAKSKRKQNRFGYVEGRP